VNRLAKTTSSGMRKDSELSADIIKEAQKAVGCDQKVGWSMTSSNKKSSSSPDRSKKKELTAKQKEVLAKLKKKPNN
jgi:hypothetical protein